MASGNSPEKLGRSGVAGGHCMVVRTESLRAQSARHRVDQPTISGRSCANSARYKPLFACVDRTFVKSISSRRRPEKKERIAGEGRGRAASAFTLSVYTSREL